MNAYPFSRRLFCFLGIFIVTCFPGNPTIVQNIPVPKNFTRITLSNSSYGHWLRKLRLKPDKKIDTYNGKSNWARFNFRVWYVLGKQLLFKADLEQCADFAMRLWADYHKETGRLGNLALFDYNGRKKPFSVSGKSYLNYLRWHMAYSNSFSIKRGAKKVNSTRLMPGDMFVQNTSGGIGHVSVIVDAAQSKSGQRIYLVGYSYMPAQQFHVEKAKSRYGPGGWFTKKGYIQYLEDHPLSKYGQPVIRRF